MVPYLDIRGLMANGPTNGNLRISLTLPYLWANNLTNTCVMFHNDDKVLVEVINKKTTKDRELLVLVCTLLKHNILFKASPPARDLHYES